MAEALETAALAFGVDRAWEIKPMLDGKQVSSAPADCEGCGLIHMRDLCETYLSNRDSCCALWFSCFALACI